MKQIIGLLLCSMMLLMTSSCEKMPLEDDGETTAPQGNVVITASVYNIVPFDDTRAMQNIADYCSRLCFVLYQDGEQVKKVVQKQGDADYGQVALRLEAGTYQLLVLGHSGMGNPSLTNPEKIQFTNSTSYTDTFFYYGDLEVGTETDSHNVTMQRATSMVRFIITDERPANVTQIRVKYTGESGVFNAVTGMGGTVNSQQYIMFDVAGMSSPLKLEIYTFLREEEGSLNVSLTAYDEDTNTIAERELANVPLKNRMVTEYTGTLFSGSYGENTFSFMGDTSWEVYEQHNF